MSPLQALSLFQKYGSLKVAELDVSVVSELTKALGLNIDVDSAVVKQVVTLLSQNNISALADIAGHPQVLTQLASFVQGPPPPRQIVRVCNHCGLFNTYEVQS
jgi:hypothetical protein